MNSHYRHADLFCRIAKNRFLFSILLCFLLILQGFFLSSCSNEETTPKAAGESAVEHAQKHMDPKYICPMHPEIISDEPGSCPICGMSLVEKKVPAADMQTETAVEHAQKHMDPSYICPMHPEIISDEPGSCPICGMNLVAREQQPAMEQSMPVVQVDNGILQKMAVRTATVERGQLSKTIRTVGYVSYNERRLSHVKTNTFGWVENFSVRREGLKVERGQLLLELYSPEFLEVQHDFLQAQQKDESGILRKYGQRDESVRPRDYLRYLDLSESAINEIARTGQAKHRIPIYAPQHGTIVRHNIRKHMFIPPGFTMFSIADLSTVWVEADIFEHQLEWIRRGLKASIQVKALPGRSWDGRLNYIYPELDARTRTVRVRLLVPNPDADLKPNMFAQVSIFSNPLEDILKIPREALIVTGERESVILALGEGRFQPVDVVSGLRSKGEVEIISGLKEGDRIVVSGQFLIDSEANLQASFSRFSSGGR